MHSKFKSNDIFQPLTTLFYICPGKLGVGGRTDDDSQADILQQTLYEAIPLSLCSLIKAPPP